MKVGLVGGSFDPLHVGHLMLSALLLWRHAPDAVWLLPVAQHAFAKPLRPFADRLAMAELGAELLGPRFSARATEEVLQRAGGDGTSVSLLRHLTAAHPGTHFLWAMGADTWAERAAWQSFEVVERLAQVVVFNRVGAPEVAGGGPALPAIASRDIRARVQRGEAIAELVPAGVERYIRDRGLYLDRI